MYFFIRKLFQSTRLYIKGILDGRPATLCMVKSGSVSIFMNFLIRCDYYSTIRKYGTSKLWLFTINWLMLCSSLSSTLWLEFASALDSSLCYSPCHRMSSWDPDSPNFGIFSHYFPTLACIVTKIGQAVPELGSKLIPNIWNGILCIMCLN